LGVRRSRWVWGRWLRANGFSPQKPARRAYEQDPAAVGRWLAEEYPAIRRQAQAEGAEVHWADEMGVRSDHQAGRSYAPRGRTPAVRVSGRRFAAQVIAAVTNRGVLRFRVSAGRFTQAVFTDFLRRLLASVPGRVYLIIDRHPVHRGRRVAAWVAAQGGRLRLVFLPPYSPELNPGEMLNNDVKGHTGRSPRPADREQLAGDLRSYLRSTQRRPDIVRNYFRAPTVRYAA
jgi:hypothetical protein